MSVTETVGNVSTTINDDGVYVNISEPNMMDRYAAQLNEQTRSFSESHPKTTAAVTVVGAAAIGYCTFQLAKKVFS